MISTLLTISKRAPLAALFILSIGPSVQAEAQVSLSIRSMSGDGGERTTIDQIALGLNRADCDGTATVTIAPPTGMSLAVDQADIWLGDGDCNETASRNGTDQNCNHAEAPTINNTDGSFVVSLDALDAAYPTLCGSGAPQSGQTYTIYVLLTGQAMFTGDVTAEQYGTVSLVVDSVAPLAPVIDVENRMLNGDSQVSVRWDVVNEMDSSYRVFQGGACGSGATASSSPIGQDTEMNATMRFINPASDLSLAEGQSVAIFVAAVDKAGNLGALSAEICVERVAIASFCDVHSAMGGTDCENNCAVSTPGSADRSFPFGAAALVFAALGLVVTRRRFR